MKSVLGFVIDIHYPQHDNITDDRADLRTGASCSTGYSGSC